MANANTKRARKQGLSNAKGYSTGTGTSFQYHSDRPAQDKESHKGIALATGNPPHKRKNYPGMKEDVQTKYKRDCDRFYGRN